MMRANDINVVRTYTVPPRSLLDTEARHGLRVMVGLAWEQHIAFLDDWRRARGAVLGADAARAAEVLGWSSRHSALDTIVETAWWWWHSSKPNRITAREQEIESVRVENG